MKWIQWLYAVSMFCWHTVISELHVLHHGYNVQYSINCTELLLHVLQRLYMYCDGYPFDATHAIYMLSGFCIYMYLRIFREHFSMLAQVLTCGMLYR